MDQESDSDESLDQEKEDLIPDITASYILRNLDVVRTLRDVSALPFGYEQRNLLQHVIRHQCLFASGLVVESLLMRENPFLRKHKDGPSGPAQMFTKPLVGVIGAGGQQGAEIVRTFLQHDWAPFRIAVCGRNASKLQDFRDLGCVVMEAHVLVAACQVVIIAVGQSQLKALVSNLGELQDKMVISIVAGMPTAQQAETFKTKHFFRTRVDRVLLMEAGQRQSQKDQKTAKETSDIEYAQEAAAHWVSGGDHLQELFVKAEAWLHGPGSLDKKTARDVALRYIFGVDPTNVSAGEGLRAIANIAAAKALALSAQDADNTPNSPHGGVGRSSIGSPPSSPPTPHTARKASSRISVSPRPSSPLRSPSLRPSIGGLTTSLSPVSATKESARWPPHDLYKTRSAYRKVLHSHHNHYCKHILASSLPLPLDRKSVVHTKPPSISWANRPKDQSEELDSSR